MAETKRLNREEIAALRVLSARAFSLVPEGLSR
jgi:hypothetical protein